MYGVLVFDKQMYLRVKLSAVFESRDMLFSRDGREEGEEEELLYLHNASLGVGEFGQFRIRGYRCLEPPGGDQEYLPFSEPGYELLEAEFYPESSPLTANMGMQKYFSGSNDRFTGIQLR